jgi:hypothetical protein
MIRNAYRIILVGMTKRIKILMVPMTFPFIEIGEISATASTVTVVRI